MEVASYQALAVDDFESALQGSGRPRLVTANVLLTERHSRMTHRLYMSYDHLLSDINKGTNVGTAIYRLKDK